MEGKDSNVKSFEITKDGSMSADIEGDGPDEQGQEVLWLENAADPSTPKSKSPIRNKLPKTQRIAQVIADGSKSHVIVLPELTEECNPREAHELAVKMRDKVVDSESRLLITAEKVAAAKQLLEQALNEKSDHRSKELSDKAFTLALEARSLVELPTNTSEELTTVLNDASTKGKAEVLKVQELKHQPKDGASPSKGENHASRARSLMDFILPENKVATPMVSVERFKQLSHSELESANSVDAIFKDTARPKDFDVLSMSSLNAILDEEETTISTFAQTINETPRRELNIIKTKSTTERQIVDTTKTNAERSDASGEPQVTQSKSSERNKDSERKHPSRKSGLFGGLFVSKHLKREKRKETQKCMSDTIALAVLTASDAPWRDEPDYDAIDPNEELHAKVAAIDERVRDALHDAIINDETESITSLNNVKIHFIQDTSANRAQRSQEQILEATEFPERLALSRKAAESVRPLLVAAPKAHSSLHLSDTEDRSTPADYGLSIAGKKPTLKNQKGKEKHQQKKQKSKSPLTEILDHDNGVFSVKAELILFNSGYARSVCSDP